MDATDDMNGSYTSASEAIGAGLLVFAVGAIWGLRLVYRGMRDDTRDPAGNRVAGRAWFIGGGLALVLAFVGFVWFVWREGYFHAG
jgi:hypothetical protein